MKQLCFLLLTITTAALGGPVLDLGKVQFEGKFRGPNINWVESGKMARAIAHKVTRVQLKEMEKDLLEDRFPNFEHSEVKGKAPNKQ
jgi:hypothetical protein